MKKILKFIFAAMLSSLDHAVLFRTPSPGRPRIQKASVKFSALVTGLKGKIGGTVFQGSKTGYAAKNKPSGNYVKAVKWLFGNPLTAINWSNSQATLLELEPALLALADRDWETSF